MLLRLDTRAYVPNLILVNDLMPEIKNKDILSLPCYFGKYGEIMKVIFQENLGENKKKKGKFSAFITYKSQLQASIAIVAMQRYTHDGYMCYCNFGTSRFCKFYVQGLDCTNSNCFYLHSNQRNYVILQEKHKFRNTVSIQRAKKVVLQNLSYFIQKQHQQALLKRTTRYVRSLVKCECNMTTNGEQKYLEFPSISSTFEELIKAGQLQQKTYLLLKKEYQEKLLPKLEEKKAFPTIQVVIEAHKSEQKAQAKKKDKLQGMNKDKKQGSKKDKAKKSHFQMPYIFKRYLNPAIKQRSLSPRSKLKEEYCKRREQLLLKNTPRDKIFSQNRKKYRQTNVNFLIHNKILNYYLSSELKKSIYKFVEPQSLPQGKIKCYVLNALSRN